MPPPASRARRLLAGALRRLAERLAPAGHAPGSAWPGGPPVAGPPADWVERVRRGAPELLQPGGVKAIEVRRPGPEFGPPPLAAPFATKTSPPEVPSSRSLDVAPPAQARTTPPPLQVPAVIAREWDGWASQQGSERHRPGPWIAAPVPAPQSDAAPALAWPQVTAGVEAPRWAAAGERSFPLFPSVAGPGPEAPAIPPAWPARPDPEVTWTPVWEGMSPTSLEAARPLASVATPEAARFPDARHRPAATTWRGTPPSREPAPGGAVELPHIWPDLPVPDPPDDEGVRLARATVQLHEHERLLEREQRG